MTIFLVIVLVVTGGLSLNNARLSHLATRQRRAQRDDRTLADSIQTILDNDDLTSGEVRRELQHLVDVHRRAP